MRLKLFYLLLLILLSKTLYSVTFVEVMNLAINNNYQYKAYIEEFNNNYASKNLAKSYLLPTINFNSSVSTSRVYAKTMTQGEKFSSLNRQNYVIGLRLEQMLYNRQAWSEFSKSKLIAKKAEIGLEARKNGLFIKTAQLYFNVLKAQSNIDSLIARNKYLKTMFDSISRKLKIGESSERELKKVESEYNLAQHEFSVAENQLSLAITMLSKHLNKEVIFTNMEEKSYFDITIEEFSSENLQDLALQQNLEILSAQIDVEISDYNIKSQKSTYFPTVSTNIAGGSTVRDNNKEQGKIENEISIGITLNMNLYNGGATSIRVEQATASKKEAEFLLRNLENEILSSSMEIYFKVTNTISAINANEERIDYLQNELRYANAAHTNGLGTIDDILDANKFLLEAKKDYLHLNYQLFLNVLELKSIVGIITEEDILTINNYLL